MSRFPIRTQVLMLGTVFVLQILVVAAISWGVQARLADAIHYGHDITSQNRALSLLEERIERIAAGFLKFEHSSNDVLDEIREEIATLSTLVDEADDVFTRTDTEAAYRPHFVPEFQSVAEIAQTLVQPGCDQRYDRAQAQCRSASPSLAHVELARHLQGVVAP